MIKDVSVSVCSVVIGLGCPISVEEPQFLIEPYLWPLLGPHDDHRRPNDATPEAHALPAKLPLRLCKGYLLLLRRTNVDAGEQLSACGRKGCLKLPPRGDLHPVSVTAVVLEVENIG